MPSKTDFNVSPYFDDFSKDKKFHRVMYRPAFAVQARELTTQQTINQNQIEQFGDHMFEHGAMVIPGQISLDITHYSVILSSFNGTLSSYKGNTLTGATSGIVADVIGFSEADVNDEATLFVKYRNSGTDNVSFSFDDGEILTSGQTAASTAVVDQCFIGSAASIDAGTYYINGFFVNVDQQTLVIQKYTNTPDGRIGLTINESFVTSTDDTSILDNATGSSNANATGAHRFKIDLILDKKDINSVADSNFVELMRVINGKVQNKVSNTQYNIIEDTLARRTYDESGDYAVRNFDLDVREHLFSATNRGIYASGDTSTDGNTAIESKLALGLSQGKAYVKGYEITKIGTTYIDIDKARDFDTASGSTTRFNIGSFVNVKNVFGTPDIGFVSGEAEAFKSVRLVDEAHGTRGAVFAQEVQGMFDIGRAKSRAFEHNNGSASTNFLSSVTVQDTVFKHFLFDIEMFVHVNVKGAMSGALTTGDILTGSSSGATGVIESLTNAGSATITGATQSDPVVISMSGGHTFTEGQTITIANVAGMTGINGTHTVKNSTSTTLELFAEATASNVTPEPLDGTGFSAWTSGGTVVHTTIVLNNIKGEFSAGETITAPTNSRTGTVQFDSFGCKGFEQKEFSQTKGISMAGSPTYTANTSLSSTFGSVIELSGTVSTVSATDSQGSVLMDGTDANGANSGDSIILEDATESSDIIFSIGLEAPADLSDRLVGSGTKFLTDLRIGDSIEFVDDGGSTETRIVDSISSDTVLETSVGLGTATATSKTFSRKRSKLQSAEKNTAIASLPYDVVKTLLTADNSSVSDTSFKIRRQFVATLSSSGTATITAGTNELFTVFTENDYSVSIMTTGSGGTGAAGDVISLSTADDFTLGGSPTGKTLTVDLGSGYNGHKIKILATISASVIGAKTKTNTAATQTVDTEALATATAINLGKADVFKLSTVHMAADFSTAATTSNIDITDRFDLDTGQRDNFYDVGRLVRKTGAQAPTGRLLISFEFFTHGTGNFFSVDSYSGFNYGSIPKYTSDVTGEEFELRDVLDFRPRVDDASTIDSGDKDRTFDGTGASTVEVIKINTDITADLEFYLAKKARIHLTKSGLFSVISGASALEPSFPEELKDSMHLYDLTIPAFTFKTSDVKVKAVDNRRYTMRDIGRIQRRVENMEYYTQLSLLESDAKGMQIQDADGFDRFKNGIIVDNFTGHGVGEVSNADYRNSMDIAAGELRPAFHQDNINLIESDSALGNSTAMTDAIRTTNGYQKTGDLITLPYVQVEFAFNDYASTTVNLNPYDTIDFIGNIKLSPDNDEWFDTETQPEMTIEIPNVYDTLTELASKGVLDLNLGTIWNNWNDTWTGVRTDTGNIIDTHRTYISGNQILKNKTTSVATTERVDKARTGVRTAMIPGGVQNHSLGNRVIQVAFASFIRAKTITFNADSMKPLTRIFPFFDGIDISDLVTPTGSSAGAALTTDSTGSASGTFAIPDPSVSSNERWRTGTRSFRLTSNSANSYTGDIYTSAETDYVAKGMIQQVQGSIVSTREPQIKRTQLNESTSVQVVAADRIISNSTTVVGVLGQTSAADSGPGGNGGGNIITKQKNTQHITTDNGYDTTPAQTYRDIDTAANYQNEVSYTPSPKSGGQSHSPGPSGPSAPSGGGGSCFIAGTKISMTDGTLKNIEEVSVGDMVKGHKGNNKVIALDPTLLANRKLYSFNDNEHYFFTSEHPFMTEEGWKSIKPEKTKERDGVELYNQLTGELKIGDKLVTENGLLEITDIRSKEINEPDMPLYNFHISNDNSYIADKYVVHNKGGSPSGPSGPSGPSSPSGGNMCGPGDPVAQGLYINQEDGIFATSIDLFFSSKSSSLPVTLQLRTMVNGYPTQTVLPFSEVTKQASEITTSTDASVATTFTFDSPVFLQSAVEYAFVAVCSTSDYTIYTARLGQTTLDGSRLISKQPYLGSMFKSQNASTWTPDQNETVKFILRNARFDHSTTGTVNLVNDVVPTQLLKLNPIEVNATAGSGSTFGSNPAIIKINARNHGMHSTSHNVTIAGVPSGEFNGLTSTNINGTYTAIGNITLDSFTVTAQNSDVATSTGSIGGTAVTTTKNILYDVIQPVVGLVQPVGTRVTSNLRKTGGRTLEQSETEFSLTTVAQQVGVELNNDFYTTSPGMVCSAINETNEMSGSKSLSISLTLRTERGNGHISPVFDTTRMSAHLIQNRLNKPISGTTPEFVIETANTGGSVENKYITKPIILENESTALDIRITANVASTAQVKMYYRLSNADDARKMGDLDWRAFNTDGSADTAVPPTENRFQFKEHKFSQDNLTTFTAFQLKITMEGTSSCYPPRVKDLRGIALAV